MSSGHDSQLQDVLRLYGYKCFWCRTDIVRVSSYRKMSSHEKSKYRVATIDHLLPQSFAGTNNLKNLRPSCTDCNGARGNGWHKDEAEVFPSCPLLQKLEKEKKNLNIKLSFPDSTKWHAKWGSRLRYTILPYVSKQEGEDTEIKLDLISEEMNLEILNEGSELD